MKIISWNSCELGNPRGACALRDLVMKKVPELLFLLGFDGCLAVDIERRSGAISLMWKNEVVLSICSYSKSHIDAMVIEGGRDRREWQLIGVYGQLDTTKRDETWELLRSLKREGNHA